MTAEAVLVTPSGPAPCSPVPPALAPAEILPVLRRLLSEVNRRVAMKADELLNYLELFDFSRVVTPHPDEPAKLSALRKQLVTALHQHFRNRWPTAKSDWTTEEKTRGWDRPTGNRTLGSCSIDLSALGVPYINAARILGVPPSNLSYVVTQHPLPCTVGHFWRMVLLLQPAAILMLNGAPGTEDTGDGTDELAAYWQPESLLAANDPAVVIQQTKVEFCDEEADCILRPLSCRLDGLEWSGLHLMVSWWQDQTEPPLRKFLALHRLLDGIVGASGSPPRPLLVHCAGGIGRAGVFLAADCGARAIVAGCEPAICTPDRMVAYLRQCRMNMVQTADQYEFLHIILPPLIEQLQANAEQRSSQH